MALRRWIGKLFLFLLLVILLFLIGANVWRLSYENPERVVGSVVRVRNGFSDFYVAKNGSRVMLFDAGMDPLGRALDAVLKENSAKREEVSDVFISHGHGDHFAGVMALKHAPRVHVGAKDVEMMATPLFADPIGAKLVASILFPVPGVRGTVPIEGATMIPVGAGQSVRAIPFAGHTPGSYLYLWEGVLFVGDSINLVEGKLEPAMPFFTVDVEQNRKSIIGLKGALAGAKVDYICTAHGACTPSGQAMKMLDDLVGRIK